MYFLKLNINCNYHKLINSEMAIVAKKKKNEQNRQKKYV